MNATSAALGPMEERDSPQPVLTMVLGELIDSERHSDREMSNGLDTETRWPTRSAVKLMS